MVSKDIDISLRQTRIVSPLSQRRLAHHSTSRCKHLHQDVCPKCLWHWHFLSHRALTAFVFPPGEHGRWNLIDHSYVKIPLRLEHPHESFNVRAVTLLTPSRPGRPYRGTSTLKSEGDDMLLPDLPAHRQSHFR